MQSASCNATPRLCRGEKKGVVLSSGHPSIGARAFGATQVRYCLILQPLQANRMSTDDAADAVAAMSLVEGTSAGPIQPHPIEHRWTLWYDNPGNKKASKDSWFDMVKKVSTFDTVEDFWCVHSNILAPGRLAPGCNYHLFKDGIMPMWEDAYNKAGGKWIIAIPKAKKEALDELWLLTVLSCIGELYGEGEEVCGAVVSPRRMQDKIALWTKTASSEATVMKIGRTLKQTLNLPETFILGYQSHADSYMKNSSYNNKNLYEV